jgi:hypothetical protein
MTQSVTPSQALVRAGNRRPIRHRAYLQTQHRHGVEARGAYSGANAGQSSGEAAQGLPLTAEHVVFPLVALRLMYADGTGFRRLRSACQSATREGGGMTKLRTPLSFSRAITTIAAAIGWEAAAKVTGRSVRTVRHWSESDRHGTPTLDQALALDRAFIAAGGDHGPILSSYGLQLDVALVDAVACRTALAEDIAATTRETGDAISHCIQALHPGATPAQIYRAIAETEEADALFPRLLGRLKALLPGTGAGREATGEMR